MSSEIPQCALCDRECWRNLWQYPRLPCRRSSIAEDRRRWHHCGCSCCRHKRYVWNFQCLYSAWPRESPARIKYWCSRGSVRRCKGSWQCRSLLLQEALWLPVTGPPHRKKSVWWSRYSCNLPALPPFHWFRPEHPEKKDSRWKTEWHPASAAFSALPERDRRGWVYSPALLQFFWSFRRSPGLLRRDRLRRDPQCRGILRPMRRFLWWLP